jgi:hypothetical protein
MPSDTALIKKREELKRRLAMGEYKTLVDVFLVGTDRLIRKITRRSRPFPLWLITVFLSLVVSLITFGSIYIAGGLTSIRIVAELFGLGYGVGFMLFVSLVVLIIATVIIINQSIGRIFALWHDCILDASESVASLQEFEDWLDVVCNRRFHLLAAVVGGLLGGLFMVIPISNQSNALLGYRSIFGMTIVSIFIGSSIYQVFVVGLLAGRLRRYDLRLFAPDPGSSELIHRLSGELGFFVYFVAIYAAILTLANALSRSLQISGIVVVLFLWLPIIAMFVLNQTGLSSIIRRVKWKTLNEIQAKVEKIQEMENFEDKEKMDAINRLMDYHDRVKKTRNSALDLAAVLNFINSLLLPLLAFIFGNFGLILKLFARNP